MVSSLLLGGLVLGWPGTGGAQTSYTCTRGGSTVGSTTALHTDCNTLLNLKDDLRGTATLNWSDTLNMNSWTGVTIAGTPPRVTRLLLGYRGLTGSIPEGLKELSKLQRLGLNNNNLSAGPIPLWVNTHLTSLTHLILAASNRTGTIPNLSGLSSTLRNLDLASNRLSGSIPSTLNALTMLTYLDLSNNQLSEEIPDLSDLDALQQLNLHNNRLTSPIPALNGLAALLDLHLSNNRFSGTIPASSALPVTLTTLNLNNNALTSPIPDLRTLSALATLNLSNNQLSGTIPASSALPSTLTWLSLADNQFSGEITDLNDQTGLSHLDLSNNNFTPGLVPAWLSSADAPFRNSLYTLVLNNTNRTGAFPDLSNLTILANLYLQNNQLSSIPSLSGLTSLQWLYLHNNRLTGRIPSLSGLRNLWRLFLHNNQLSGTIPAFPTGANRLRNLQWLYLHNNQLSGTIPALSTLTNLAGLFLYNNQLSGTIPSLSGLINLQHLRLQNNQLTNAIPHLTNTNALRHFNLSNNRLTGGIPNPLSTLTNLEYFNLSNNQLVSFIPTDLSGLTNLQTFNLSNNRLTGAIPTALSGLANLRDLNLSNNQLTGPILTWSSAQTNFRILNLGNNNLTQGPVPTSVNTHLTNLTELRLNSTNRNGAFPTLSNLTNLEILDLSNNAFDPAGAIPPWVNTLTSLTELRLGNTNRDGSIQNLSNLRNLKILDLSSNALTGHIPAYLSGFPLEELYLNDNRLTGSLPSGLRTVGVLRLDGNTACFDSPCPSNLITITTLADTLTADFATYALGAECGTIVDIDAFPANPTLREALIYANATDGAETITFASYLSGRTLALADGIDSGTDPDPLPWLCGANLTLDGDVNGDGTPDITLDGTGSSNTAGLYIAADDITVRNFRITNMDIGIHVRHHSVLMTPATPSVTRTQITNNTITSGTGGTGSRYGILVQAGHVIFPGTISDTTIRDNTITKTSVAGIGVMTEVPGTTITNTTIEQNEVSANTGDGIAAWSESVNTALVHSINNLTIRDNHVSDHPTGSGITVTGGFNGGNYNRVTATLTGNTIWRSGQAGDAGLALTGGRKDADSNTVTATLSDNLVARYAALSSGSAGHGLALQAAAADPTSSTSSDNTLTVTGQGNLISLTRNSGDTSHYDIFRQQGNSGATRTGNTLTDSLTGTIFANQNQPTADVPTITDPDMKDLFDTNMGGILVTIPDPPELPALPEVDDFTMRLVPASLVPSAEPPLNTQFSAGKNVFDITVSWMGTAVTTRLTTPVRVCLPRPPDVPASQAHVLRYNAATRTWERLLAGRTVSTSQVCVNVFQFSYFTVGKDLRSSDDGGGGGGGGTPTDTPGNTPATATALTPGTPVAGELVSSRDVDYFRFTLPLPGVLRIETTGFTNTVGTLWVAGEEEALATDDDSGTRSNFRLAQTATTGTYTLAVSGKHGATGPYRLTVHYSPGFLGNPSDTSFQSGIGVLSGWVCNAERVVIEFDRPDGRVWREPAAYGTSRPDTAAVCADSNSGFGLLWNWTKLGAGPQTVRAVVDDIVLAEHTITVTTLGLGKEFPLGLSGTYEVPDFPEAGETTRIQWQEAQQNFAIVSGAGGGGGYVGDRMTAALENPQPGSFQSGISVLSGWVCEAETVKLVFENGVTGETFTEPAGYGTSRTDTVDECGDKDNGFGLLWNWNRLGAGQHTVRALADGEEFAHSTFTVTTFGEEFARGLEGGAALEDFPTAGQTVTVEWEQALQNFVIMDRQ